MLTPDSSSSPLLIYPGKPKPDTAAYRKESGPFDAVLDEGGRAIFMPVAVASTEPEAFFLICTKIQSTSLKFDAVGMYRYDPSYAEKKGLLADNTIDSGCSQDPKTGKPCPEIWLIPICPIKNPSTGAFIDARASEPYHDTIRKCLAPRNRSKLARISRTSPEVTYPMPSRTKQIASPTKPRRKLAPHRQICMQTLPVRSCA